MKVRKLRIEILKYIIQTIAWLFVLSFAIMWAMHLIWETYSYIRTPESIWNYEFIDPKTPEFQIANPISMISKSIYWALWLIIWDDYLLCASDYWKEILSDEEMDQVISDKSHRKLETTFTEQQLMWDVWGKWDIDWDGILDWEWIFWWENTIDWKKFYITKIIWTWCYIRSHQTFFYNWIEKKQRFTSWPFNIIK